MQNYWNQLWFTYVFLEEENDLKETNEEDEENEETKSKSQTREEIENRIEVVKKIEERPREREDSICDAPVSKTFLKKLFEIKKILEIQCVKNKFICILRFCSAFVKRNM